MVDRQTFELLKKSARPANRYPDRFLRLPDSEEQLFGMLSQKSRARLQIFCLAQISRFDCDGSTDSIAIAFVSRADGKRSSRRCSFITL